MDFGPVEENRQDAEHVFPVAWMIGLEDKFSAGCESAMGEQQEFGSDQSQADLIATIPRLWVVAVNFGDGRWRGVEGEKFAAADDGPAGMEQSALISAAGGIADDNGKHVHAECVVFGVSKCEVEE